MSSDELLELNNRIIAIGIDVIFGWLLPEEALEKVQKDPELANLPDERLQALIEETGQYWREKLDIEVSHPENIVIYTTLMVECAETRLKAVSRLISIVNDERKPSLDLRKARWITILTQCFLDTGMLLLLQSNSESAWKTFTTANWGGRALPDFGQLRLREVLWACYGQRIAALMGNQKELARMAEQEAIGLMQLPNREQEAKSYLEEIQSEFERIVKIRQYRQELQRGQKLSTDDQEIGNIPYIHLLTTYGRFILEDRMRPDEAKEQLLGGHGPPSINFSKLHVREIYFASIFHRQLAESEPVLAVILADLNYAVACAFTDDKAERVRLECAYALGTALLKKARQLKGPMRRYNYWLADPEICVQAIPYFEEAFIGFNNQDTLDQQTATEAALIQTDLVLCYKGIGNDEKAIEISHDAIRRLEALPDQRSNLGVTYGNLAGAQEQIGEDANAFNSRYKAFQIFLDANDMRNVRKALDHLSRLCERTGRLDDAIAACERALYLSMQVADLVSIADIYSLLTNLLSRTRRYEDLKRILLRMSNLVGQHASIEQVEPQYRPLYCDLLTWLGTAEIAYVSSVRANSDDLKKGHQVLEKARKLAIALQDDYRRDSATLQLAKLFIAANQFDQAEHYCNMIDGTSCLPFIRSERDGNLGEIRFRQKKYREALDLFQQAIAPLADLDSQGRYKTVYWLYRVGDACNCLNDTKRAIHAYEMSVHIFEQMRFEVYEDSRIEITGNALEIYDRLIVLYSNKNKEIYAPKQGIFWLEKSKSRTFVETLGLSNILVQEPSKNIQQDLLEEQLLLQSLNMLRGRLFFSSEDVTDRLELQQEIYTSLERLKGIWDRIALSHPEYIELRRGSVVEWSELQTILRR
ncbi:MAG: hypothetical protein M3Z24_00905 [Chloroflexota bacterium]|nr:hypothetical protein [Chloroflexota bacterium]